MQTTEPDETNTTEHDVKNNVSDGQTVRRSHEDDEAEKKRLAVERAFREDAAAGMQYKRKRTSIWSFLLSVLVVLVLLGLYPVWFVGTISIAMGSLHKAFYFPLWNVFILSLGVCLLTLKIGARKLRIISACVQLASSWLSAGSVPGPGGRWTVSRSWSRRSTGASTGRSRRGTSW
ncbi:MAG: hypothetical protein IKQ82_07875 [Lentisphaeria bacterium]|nr:hypothetical protein [Lentisphaeria bacterium]